MNLLLSGTCHCGNLSYEVRSRVPFSKILARACDCNFCRIHAAKNWSDPEGFANICIGDVKKLQKYKFALKTADFYICRECGAYLGAVLSDQDGTWSTVNLRLIKSPIISEIANYGVENTSERIERRKRVWTPTVVTDG